MIIVNNFAIYSSHINYTAMNAVCMYVCMYVCVCPCIMLGHLSIRAAAIGDCVEAPSILDQALEYHVLLVRILDSVC